MNLRCDGLQMPQLVAFAREAQCVEARQVAKAASAPKQGATKRFAAALRHQQASHTLPQYTALKRHSARVDYVANAATYRALICICAKGSTKGGGKGGVAGQH